MNKCSSRNQFAGKVPAQSLYVFARFCLLLVLLPGFVDSACDCTLNLTTRQFNDNRIRTEANKIITNFTAEEASNVANYTNRAFDLHESLNDCLKSRGIYQNLTDFVLRGGLRLWVENEMPAEIKNKVSKVDIDTLICNETECWDVPMKWYPATVNLTAYLKHAYMYRLHETLRNYTLKNRTPLGWFSVNRYRRFLGVDVVNRGTIQSPCTCRANYGYMYSFKFSVSSPMNASLPLNTHRRELKTDFELAVDNYLSGFYPSTYLHSIAAIPNPLGMVGWNVSMRVYFLGSVNNSVQAMPDSIKAMSILKLPYTGRNATIIPAPLTFGCTYFVRNDSIDDDAPQNDYDMFSCSLATTQTSVPLTNSTVSSSSRNITTAVTEALSPTASTSTSLITTMIAMTSTPLINTTFPTITQVTTEKLTSTASVAGLTSTTLNAVMMSPTTLATVLTDTTHLETTTLQSTTVENTTLPSVPTPATMPTINDATSSVSQQSTTGLMNTTVANISTNSASNGTVQSTVSVNVTFDPDPFFKASVPVVTKIYNDRVLLSRIHEPVSPFYEKQSFYTITIPVAISLIAASFACLLCLQVDWVNSLNKSDKPFKRTM